MKKVIVNTASNSYPVYIGSNIFEDLPEVIEKYSLPKSVFVILDKNVERIYGSTIRRIVSGFAGKKYFLLLPASESIKSFKTADQIINRLYRRKIWQRYTADCYWWWNCWRCCWFRSINLYEGINSN